MSETVSKMNLKRKIGVAGNRVKIFAGGTTLDRKLFFVTGRSKCGTTWLGRMLGHHLLVYCDIKENNLAHQDREVTYFNDDPFFVHSQARAFFRERDDDIVRAAAKVNLVYDCPKPTALFFGDKTPRQDVEYLTRVFPGAAILFMVRDPRDMIVSLAFHNKALAPNEVDEFSRDDAKWVDHEFVTKHISHYNRVRDIKRMLSARESNPNLTIVRYEDLKRDCEDELKRCFAHIGVPTTTAYVRHIVKRNSFGVYASAERRTAGHETGKDFYRKGIIGDWKNHLREESSAFIEREMQEEMTLMGYL